MKTKLMAVCVALAALAVAAERPWVIENEDNDHYFYGKPEKATKASLEAYADSLLEGDVVTHVFWCVNGQRVNYDSKVWDPIWAALADPDVQWGYCSKEWPTNAKLMHDAGIDPYRVWIDRTRAKGASPWVSMRMNDNHDCWLKHGARVCQWYKDHREFRIDPEFKGGQWEPYALDFAHPEVRDYTFALVEEIVNRYDADGIELDFLRASSYFRPDDAKKNAPIMTAFVRRCRAAAEQAGAKRGRKYQVAIRVAATPEGALASGFDVGAIAREGLVDVVIACNQSNRHWDVPVKAWKALLAATPKVRFVAGTTAWSHTPESLRGWAETMREQGVEDFYVFNLQWANEQLRRAVHPGAAFTAAVCRQGARTYVVDEFDPPPAPARHVVKGDFVKAAFRPDGWRYAVDGGTPRAFDFSKRTNLRVKAKPDGGDYPVLAKARLTGELVAERDGEVALGVGFDWRWEMDVNGQRVFGRNALVDADDSCRFRADDWTVRAPVKKGVNAVAFEIALGTCGWGEARVLGPAETKDGIDVAPQEEYAQRAKSGKPRERRPSKFNAALTRALRYERMLPATAKPEKGAWVAFKLTNGVGEPAVVRLNGVAATGVEKKQFETFRTLRYAFPAAAAKAGLNEIETGPAAGKPTSRVTGASLSIE